MTTSMCPAELSSLFVCFMYFGLHEQRVMALFILPTILVAVLQALLSVRQESGGCLSDLRRVPA